MRKLLASKTITGAAFQADVDPETYDYYLLRVTGTQAGGAFIAIGEVGRVFYRHGADVIVDCDFDMLHFMNEVKGGDVECTGEANGAAFAFSAMIPRGFLDKNIEAVETTDKAQVVLQYGPNVASQIASGTVELYGVTKDLGEENYSLQILQHNQDFSAASKQRFLVPQDNVIAIYTDRGFGQNNGTAKASLAASANFTEMAIKKDGQESGSVPVGVHQSMSNWENRLEATGFVRCFENVLATEGEIIEQLSDDVVITAVATGAVVVRHLVISAVFDAAKRERTVRASEQVAQVKIARKADKPGGAEAIETLRQLTAAA